jgi:hypothetical protein
MTPEAFERPRPFVERPDCLCVRAVEHLASVASHMDETDVAKHLQVLRHGRLCQLEGVNDVGDGAFIGREKGEDVAAPGFGNRVENV